MRRLQVTYLTAECYPAAKVGGLADVMGSLPLYLEADVEVVMPKYKMPWFENQKYKNQFSDHD